MTERISDDALQIFKDDIGPLGDMARELIERRAAEKPGWQLVPPEATMGMWDDFCAVHPVEFEAFMAAYHAMIAGRGWLK